MKTILLFFISNLLIVSAQDRIASYKFFSDRDIHMFFKKQDYQKKAKLFFNNIELDEDQVNKFIQAGFDIVELKLNIVKIDGEDLDRLLRYAKGTSLKKLTLFRTTPDYINIKQLLPQLEELVFNQVTFGAGIVNDIFGYTGSTKLKRLTINANEELKANTKRITTHLKTNYTMRQLTYLDLSNNNLDIKIFSGLGNLSREVSNPPMLETLILNNNDIKYELTSAIKWNSGLFKNLKRLEIIKEEKDIEHIEKFYSNATLQGLEYLVGPKYDDTYFNAKETSVFRTILSQPFTTKNALFDFFNLEIARMTLKSRQAKTIEEIFFDEDWNYSSISHLLENNPFEKLKTISIDNSSFDKKELKMFMDRFKHLNFNLILERSLSSSQWPQATNSIIVKPGQF